MAGKVVTTGPEAAKTDVLVALVPKTKKGGRLPLSALDKALGGQIKSAISAGAVSSSRSR